MSESESKLKQLEEQNKKLEAQVALIASSASLLSQTSQSDEIDLREIWSSIWQKKWLIIAISSIFAIASIVYSLLIPNQYKATAVLAPASNSGASSLSRLAGQFGGLASLAGINLGSAGGEDKTTIAIELLKSWGFQEEFVSENKLEVLVYAVKEWDLEKDKPVYNGSIFDVEKNTWLIESESDSIPGRPPTSWELYEKFRERVSVSQDKKTGLIYLSIEHFSPKLAKAWVDLMVKQINRHIQNKDKLEAKKNIEYLTKQIEHTHIAEMKSVFYQLIEEQTKTLMLAEASEEYVLKTVSEAKVPEEKSRPKRAFIVVGFTLLGGILSTILALFLSFSKRSNRKD